MPPTTRSPRPATSSAATALDCQRVPTAQQPEGRSEDRVRGAIEQPACELADLATPLTSELMVLLKAVFRQRGLALAPWQRPGESRGATMRSVSSFP